MNHEEQEDALSKIAADKYDEDLMNIAKECFTNECGWDEYHTYCDGVYAGMPDGKSMWTVLSRDEDIAYIFIESAKTGFAKIKRMIADLPSVKGGNK